MIDITFSKPILDELHEALQRAFKKNNTKLYRVIQALIWYGEGKSASDIAKLLHLSPKSIYNWVKDFICKGFTWLFRQMYVGRGCKSRLTKAQKDELYKMIESGPEACGFYCGIWNSALIAELVMLRFGVKYNPHYLSSLLKKMGLTYQKARFISDKIDEAEYEKARKEWCNKRWPKILKDSKRTGAVILFGDEVSFAMWGSLARTWAPRGKQPVVKTTGIRKGLKMFGAIEFNGGDFQYMESFAYEITAKSIKALKAAKVPENVLKNLKSLKKERYKTSASFKVALEKVLGKNFMTRYYAIILQNTQVAGRFNGESYVEFLKQLLQHFKGSIILIEDGASYHGSKVVTDFIAEHASRLTVERLPTFSPDYNPIEKLWKNTYSCCYSFEVFQNF